ncbi:acyl transferase [Lusitaniella coriacea LEGE 07157]|uniref:Acyl transferase n=1 Tax=Lusitaniella coriacea LEGE 07157 TaxID=945747 RepID=A0A8J7E0X9_9CYAN|nr:acyl transferase [Lusitaniella coriacea]MBE9118471.1 acyl transferase [Lusitaniella coriacea LEGE 07157]
MTLLSKLLSWFTPFILLCTSAAFLWTCNSPNIFSILAIPFCLYGLPVLCHRIHNYFYPLKEGISYLISDDYSPWWGSHQFQEIYIACPFLEAILRLIPGAFSAWLRLWGAKVGNNVYWTPKLEIADRGFVEIGDRTIFGYDVQLYPHIVKPKKNNLMLYLKTIKIGSDVFLGAGSHCGPGVIIQEGTYIPVATDLYPNQKSND